MSKLLLQFRYLMQEVRTLFRLNALSNLLSLLSLALIFFVAILALSSWRVTTALVKALQAEAEISVYYDLKSGDTSLEDLISKIESADGVLTVLPISADDAYTIMSGILGQDAAVLKHFEANPFEPYLEVGIDLDHLDGLVSKINGMDDVSYVRDNRTVLEKVAKIADAVSKLGIFVVLAVGAATLIVTSHLVREGIHANREQIMTLKLLGAPDTFIYQPYVLGGVLLTTLSGALASVGFAGFSNAAGATLAGGIPFLPPIDAAGMVAQALWSTLAVSLLLGLTASFLGLRLVKDHGMRV